MNKNTDERIDITKVEDPRSVLKAADLICPICATNMIVVSATVLRDVVVRIAHFRHYDAGDCPYTSYGAGESEEHRAAKSWIRDMLLEDSGFDVPVELEYHLPQVGRIADVAQIFPTGWIVVHEIQLASITPEVLYQRSHDYLDAGCDVIWYLGGNADKPTNRDWVKNFQGFCAQITWEDHRIERHRFEQHNSEAGNSQSGSVHSISNGYHDSDSLLDVS